MLRARGLRVTRRGAGLQPTDLSPGGEAIGADTEIYLADTLGELGLFFRLAGIAFIGGSLVRKGGHNPFEAARLDCAVLHGPDMANCAAMAGALDAAGAALTVGDAASLAAAVSRLIADPAERTRRTQAAARAAAASGGALDAVLERFAPWLDALAPVALGDIAAAEMTAPPRRAISHGRADARP
jgi:3-deoxy-D-manno-octulosonic-acid transferase